MDPVSARFQHTQCRPTLKLVFCLHRPCTGQTSRVETSFLSMTLNHNSGDLDGQVIVGSYRGSRLADLDIDSLLKLLTELEPHDAQSAALLEAYLDRT